MKFGRRKGEDKLYKQWVKHSDLASEDIPQKESSGDVSAGRDASVGRDVSVDRDVPVGREKTKQVPRLLYILLIVGISLLCVGLVLTLT